MLDHRNLRTPSKNVIKLEPSQRYLALLTAAEWDAQTKVLKAHTLPLVSVWFYQQGAGTDSMLLL